MKLTIPNGPNGEWSPVRDEGRYQALDLLRGLALFGVLIVNLLYFFRASLFDHMVNFHSHPGLLNHAIDIAVVALIEFKSFTIFSFLFGVGLAIQFERSKKCGAGIELFLLRRMTFLLMFGLLHMVLISNVDILCLYAVCALIIIPLLRLPASVLAGIGLIAIYYVSLSGTGLPGAEAMLTHSFAAVKLYSSAGFLDMVTFRWQETSHLILPLLIGVAPRTFGLMLLGIASWRSGVLKTPQQYRGRLWSIVLAGGLIGGFNTFAEVLQQSTGRNIPIPILIHVIGSSIPLASAYGAMFFTFDLSSVRRLDPIRALGRMALTNYLMQSILFGFVFLGYGLGLYGRLSPSQATPLGLLLYGCQAAFSMWWLRRYRFGPFEWLWRSASYGRWQSLRS